MRNALIVIVSAVALCACTATEEKTTIITWQERTSLPEAVTNNAVASVQVDSVWHIYSFLGLGEGKTHADIHNKAFRYNLQEDRWTRIEDVPGPARLAATAETVGDRIYLFGGYTVAADGSEETIGSVYRFDPSEESYQEMEPIPVPVDDAVSMVHKDRYIYLVSGWHDDGNVDNVQVYDTRDDSWDQATPKKGSPVFGHAGGIARGYLFSADGVKSLSGSQGQREFEMTPQIWIGAIGRYDAKAINWSQVSFHPGDPKYRMAATGFGDLIVFAGGTTTPYNYNGMGYNGEPAEPDSTIFAFDVEAYKWKQVGYQKVATMDHRGLVKADDWLYIVGGMKSDQTVSDGLYRFTFSPEDLPSDDTE
ncbi:MAG: hypothetical protein R3211_06595 [Balneolaceae bacterium]|nr:hypothetical protein [Balneolaceae bacterium]